MGLQLNFLLGFSLTAIILTTVSVKGHPHVCDCSLDYETCLNVTEFGSAGFRLFGKTMTFFESDLESVLLAFDEDRFSKKNYADFYLYFLRDAHDYGEGIVGCNYTTDADTLSNSQESIRNTPVLSDNFANFNATEGLVFFYDVLTELQLLALDNVTDFFDFINAKLNLSDPIGAEDIDVTPHRYSISLITDGNSTFAIYQYVTLPSLPPVLSDDIAWTGYGYALPKYRFPQDVVTFLGSNVPPGVDPVNLLNATNSVEDGTFVFRVDQLSCFQEDEYFCITDYVKNFSVIDVQVEEATFSFVEEYFEYIEIEYTLNCNGPEDSSLFRASAVVEASLRRHGFRPPKLPKNYTPEYNLTVTGLLGGTNYTCTLTKVFDNDEFDDVPSPPINITTLTDIPDVAPPNFVCEAITDTEITATWDEVPLPQRNGQVQYMLNLTSSDNADSIQMIFPDAPSDPIVIRNLQPNTTYSCVLSAFTSAGSGPQTSILQPVTFLPIPIPIITSVTGNCSTVQVSVQWNTTENMGINLPITGISIGYDVTSSSDTITSVSDLVFPVDDNNTFTIDLSPAALLAPDIAFQASLLSSAIRGNSSEVFQFNCLPVPEPCDCSFRKEACLNLTEFGSGGFPLFGRTTHLFRGSITSVLEAYVEDTFTEFPFSEFYLYFLENAKRGGVSCLYVNSSDPLNILPDLVQDLQSTPSLSGDFSGFSPSEAIVFTFRDILTASQVAAAANNTLFFDRLNNRVDPPVPIGPADIDAGPHSYDIVLATDGTNTFTFFRYLSLPSPPPSSLGTISQVGFGYQLPSDLPPQDVVTFLGSNVPPGVDPVNLLNATNSADDGTFVFRVDQLSCFQEDEYFCITDEPRNFSVIDIQVNEATFSFTEEYFDDVEMEYIVVCEGPPGIPPCMVSTQVEAPLVSDLNSPRFQELVANFTPEYSLTVTGLLGGTNYTCTLTKVFDNNEFDDISAPPIDITTITDEPDIAPPNFACEAITDTEITATWDEVPLPQRNGQVQYMLNLTSSDNADSIQMIFPDAPSDPIVVSNLQPNTTYSCVLSAFTSAGSGPQTSILQPVTFLPIPIPTITSVTGNCSTVQVSVQWNTTENMGNNLPITDVSIGYDVTSSSDTITSVSDLVFPVDDNNTFTIDLSPAALLAPDIAFQASLLSSAIRGNSSEVFQFNCLPVPEPCDCSFRKEACLNLTEFGSGGFPLFGRTTHLFRGSITSVLEAYVEDTFTEFPFAEFYLYFLENAKRGGVSCLYVNSSDPLNILPDLVQDLQSTPSLSGDFSGFSPSEAIVFTFRDILTASQVAAAANNTLFFDRLNNRVDPPVPIGPADIDAGTHSYDIVLATDGTNTFTFFRYLSLPSPPPSSLGTISQVGFGYQLPSDLPPQDVVTFLGSNVPPGVDPVNLLNATNSADDGTFVFRVDQLSCFQEDEYFCITDEPRNFSAIDIQVNEATFSFTEEYFDDVEMEYIVVCEGPSGIPPCMVSTQVEAPLVSDLNSPQFQELVANFTPEYSLTVTGLLGGTNYTCTLTKVFDNNEFDDISAPPIDITTLTDVPDVAPPNFACEAISDSEVMATWGDIPLSQRNGQVQYVLSLTSVDQEENIHRTTLQAPTTPIVIGGLRSNTTYFCVLGVVTNRVGPHSHPQEIVTFLPVPIPTITSVTGNCSTVQVSVQWNTTENMGNNLPITGIAIRYDLTLSTAVVVSVEDIVINITGNNVYTFSLEGIASLIPNLRLQVQLLSSTVRGNASSVVPFNCVSGLSSPQTGGSAAVKIPLTLIFAMIVVVGIVACVDE